MECFQVRYDSRVVIYEHKLFIRLATDPPEIHYILSHTMHLTPNASGFQNIQSLVFLLSNCVTAGREPSVVSSLPRNLFLILTFRKCTRSIVFSFDEVTCFSLVSVSVINQLDWILNSFQTVLGRPLFDITVTWMAFAAFFVYQSWSNLKVDYVRNFEFTKKSNLDGGCDKRLHLTSDIWLSTIC